MQFDHNRTLKKDDTRLYCVIFLVFFSHILYSSIFAAAPPVNLFFERLPTEIISEILYYTVDDDQDVLASTLFPFDHDGKEISYALYQKTQYTRFITENFLKEEFFTQMFPCKEKTKNGFSFTNILLNRWFVTCDIVRNNQTQIKNPLQFFFHFYTKAQIAHHTALLLANLDTNISAHTSLQHYLLLWTLVFQGNFLCKHKLCVFIHSDTVNHADTQSMFTTLVHHQKNRIHKVNITDLLRTWATEKKYAADAVESITLNNIYMTRACITVLTHYYAKQLQYTSIQCASNSEIFAIAKKISETSKENHAHFFLRKTSSALYKRYSFYPYSKALVACSKLINNYSFQHNINFLISIFLGGALFSLFPLIENKILFDFYNPLNENIFHNCNDLKEMAQKLETLSPCKFIQEKVSPHSFASFLLKRWYMRYWLLYYNQNEWDVSHVPPISPSSYLECRNDRISSKAFLFRFQSILVPSALFLFIQIAYIIVSKKIIISYIKGPHLQCLLYCKIGLVDIPTMLYLFYIGGMHLFERALW